MGKEGLAPLIINLNVVISSQFHDPVDSPVRI